MRVKKFAKDKKGDYSNDVNAKPNRQTGEKHRGSEKGARGLKNRSVHSENSGSGKRVAGANESGSADGAKFHIEHDVSTEFSHVVYNYLKSKNHPVNSTELADHLNMKGDNRKSVLAALLHADGIMRQSEGRRPLFVKQRSGWALGERNISGEILNLENQIFDAGRQLFSIAERQVLKKLRQLSMQRLIQIVIVLLQQSGFGVIRPVYRGRGDEFHMTVKDRRQNGNFNTAVVIKKNPETVDDLTVSSLRGSLHHYSAMKGMIITPGNIASVAVKEAEIPNLAPIGFWDGETLAKEMVKRGIGVKMRTVQLVAFDDSQF
jgi:hypothetical protein